ncbi:hypothetical protein DPEC_G00214090, partial [Dallia pectoralis]
FDHPVSGRGVGDQLCELKQGNRTVADYALEFRTLAAGCGWSETALLTVYRRGLRPEVQTELACRGDITVLNEFINISISIDNLLVNHKSSAVREVSVPRPRWAAERRRKPEEEPMQLGRSPLQPSVRQQRRRDGLCLYCGQSGHFIRHCPVRPSRTTEYRLGTVKPVLERLRKYQLFVKPEKSEFHVTTVSFLGAILTPDGVKLDDSKVRAVREWPQPKTVKELQRFLGFANYYRRFVRNFSTTAAPLSAMTSQKGRGLSWTERAVRAFETLKERFTTVPILSQPDSTRPFIVEVDASEIGVGAVLSQRQGEPPKSRPCAFFSKKLNP